MTDAPQDPTPTPSHYSSVPPTYTGETTPLTPVAQPQQPAKKRGNAGVVIAAAAVAALVGGAVGAGIVVGVNAGGNNSSTSSSATGPTSITVNDSKNATTITAVAAKASPSVVTINVTGTDAAGTGSGIVMTKDGYVLTNTHVVTLDGETGSAKIKVETNSGQLLNAKLIGTDPINDLAVIKLEGVTDMQPAEFADSSELNVGDTAIAIGAPLGLAGTVTNGIVSALNRSITVASSAAPSTSGDDSSDGGSDSSSPFDYWNFQFPGQGDSSTTTATSTISLSVIQTDAAINPGNSGGALLDTEGKVIGVNVAIASAGSSSSSTTQSGSIGVGFAIPSNVAKRIGESIISTGTATHGLLGASIEDVTESKSSSTAKTVGASIVSVVAGGAASNAGLKAGDVVTNFNGIPITGKTDLTAQVRVLAAGSKASLTYNRDGRATKVTVTLGELK